MSLLAYMLMAASSLFVIIDPIATVPAFLAMTARDTPAQRIKMARLALHSPALPQTAPRRSAVLRF